MALLDPEPLQAKIWSSTIYTLTAFILVISTLMAFIQSGRARLGWIGFSVFGWAYLLLLGFELTDRGNKPRLLTTWVLRDNSSKLTRYVFHHSVEMTTFSTVGHAFFALLFALTGAPDRVFARREDAGSEKYRTTLHQRDDVLDRLPNSSESTI